jgi:hypothetical protein
MPSAASTSAFERLLTRLEGQDHTLGQRSQRHYPVYAPLSVRVCEGELAQQLPGLIHGWALDVSGRGMSWLMTQDLDIGTHVLINLRLLAGEPLEVRVRVLHRAMLVPGLVRAGGEFVLP